MSWSQIGTATTPTAVAATTITVTEPTGTAQGDLLICAVGYRDANVPDTPSGWTLIDTQTTGDTGATLGAAGLSFYYCERGSSAPTLTFTKTGTALIMARVTTWRSSNGSVVGTSPLNVGNVEKAGADIGSPFTASLTGITTTVDGCLLILAAAGGDAGTWSALNTVNDGSFTAIGTALTTTTGDDGSLHMAYLVQSTAGATGNMRATHTITQQPSLGIAAFKEPPPPDTGSWSAVGTPTTSADAASGNVTGTLPTGHAEGDVLFASLLFRDTATFTPPTDWVLVGSQLTGDAVSDGGIVGIAQYICYRGAGTPGTVWTRTGGNLGVVRISCFRHADGPITSANLNAQNVAKTSGVVAGGSQSSISGITPTEDGCLLYVGMFGGNEGTWGSWGTANITSGWLEIGSPYSSTTGADGALHAIWSYQATAAATGNVQATLTSTPAGSQNGFAIIAISPPSAGGNATGQTLTTTASVAVLGAATAGADASGQTLTLTASLAVMGTASAGTTADGQTVSATTALIDGTATGTVSATAAGQTLTATSALVDGTATGNGSAAGQTLTVSTSLIDGTASAVVSGTASGQTVSRLSFIVAPQVTVRSSIVGDGPFYLIETGGRSYVVDEIMVQDTAVVAAIATGSASISGQTITAVASLIDGTATGDASATGQTLVILVSLIDGTAAAVTDGTANGQLIAKLSSIVATAVTLRSRIVGKGQAFYLIETGVRSYVIDGVMVQDTAVAAAIATGSASISGQTITAVASLIDGTATGEGSGTATGQTLTITASLTDGTATADATASGQTLTATTALVDGTASGTEAATATGQTLTATATLTDGTATGSVSGTATGQTLTVPATLTDGTASGTVSATATGQTLTTAASLLTGAAGGVGQTLTITIALIPGTATGQLSGVANGVLIFVDIDPPLGAVASGGATTAADTVATAVSLLSGDAHLPAVGQTLTATASLEAGTGTVGVTASGYTFVFGITLTSGSASGQISGMAPGAMLLPTIDLVEGYAAGSAVGEALGQTLTATISLIWPARPRRSETMRRAGLPEARRPRDGTDDRRASDIPTTMRTADFRYTRRPQETRENRRHGTRAYYTARRRADQS
jgi:hypothetical protein